MEMITEIMGKNVAVKLNAGEMTGYYFKTPYGYTPKLGRKLIQNTYIDIGLNLLDLIELRHQKDTKE